MTHTGRSHTRRRILRNLMRILRLQLSSRAKPECRCQHSPRDVGDSEMARR
jgi:hypothetical protein